MRQTKFYAYTNLQFNNYVSVEETVSDLMR
jgi:hypothetical protein